MTHLSGSTIGRRSILLVLLAGACWIVYFIFCDPLLIARQGQDEASESSTAVVPAAPVRTAAFCITGLVRTMTAPVVHASMQRNLIEAFGAEAHVFLASQNGRPSKFGPGARSSQAGEVACGGCHQIRTKPMRA
ncbi:unnamed protein product [Polarella glacialis]|uniref:Uncharacterized protein n=1 Tax=Polarella glacialis TaxID=89957 RepID=A0A813I6Z4_POLGL|nr:unnamed protein product [Polarella glacialis]